MKENLKLLVFSVLVVLAFSIPQHTLGMEDSLKTSKTAASSFGLLHTDLKTSNTLNEEINLKHLHSVDFQGQEKLTERTGQLYEISMSEESGLNIPPYHSPITFIAERATYLKKMVDFATAHPLQTVVGALCSMARVAAAGEGNDDQNGCSQGYVLQSIPCVVAIAAVGGMVWFAGRKRTTDTAFFYVGVSDDGVKTIMSRGMEMTRDGLCMAGEGAGMLARSAGRTALALAPAATGN